MAERRFYLVWMFPVVRDRLQQRFPSVPLAEILEVVRVELGPRAEEGRQAPFPYPSGVFLLTLENNTSQGRFRITPLYEFSREDRAVEVLDIGIVRVGDGH